MKLMISVVLAFSVLQGLASASESCSTLFADQLDTINKSDAYQKLNQTLLETKNSSNYKSNGLEVTLERINCYLKSQMTENKLHAELINEIQPPLNQIIQQFIHANSMERQHELINSINRNIVRDAGTGFVLFPNTNGKNVEINLFYRLIDRHCQTEATKRCADSATLAQNLWSIVGEFRALADQLNQQDKKASLAFNNSLATQWRSYKDDTIKLWPQEVLLNSMVFKPSKKSLSAPPNYKLLTLRPALGLSYLSDQSHRFQPTVNLDLLGIYWWQYGANGKASMGRGISATAIWDGDDTALGLSYHHNPKWSLTLAQGDDNDVVVSLSFQLAHWLVNQ
jgi:hypothetical protein